jgi:hypothetical protein
MRTFRFCVIPFGLLLTSCVPVPHEQQESPELRGVLLDSGQPVANAIVRLVVNPATSMIGCPKEAKSIQTDAKGQFSFARTTYHQSVYPFGHRTDNWRICFDRPDGEQAVWQGKGTWGGPPRQDLRCEIKPPTDASAPVCTATDHTN